MNRRLIISVAVAATALGVLSGCSTGAVDTAAVSGEAKQNAERVAAQVQQNDDDVQLAEACAKVQPTYSRLSDALTGYAAGFLTREVADHRITPEAVHLYRAQVENTRAELKAPLTALADLSGFAQAPEKGALSYMDAALSPEFQAALGELAGVCTVEDDGSGPFAVIATIPGG